MAQDNMNEPVSAREQIEQLREENARLERQVKLARNALPTERDANAVTQNIAVQQEIQALRSALSEKDRIVEDLTQQCRKLEDQLEDNYQDLDGLRRQVEQRDRQLTDANTRLQDAFEMGGQTLTAAPPPEPSSTSMSTERARASSSALPPMGYGSRSVAPPQPVPRRGGGLFGGLGLGLALATLIGVGLWFAGYWPQPRAGAALGEMAGTWWASFGSAEETPDEANATITVAAQPVDRAGAESRPSPVRDFVRDPGGPEMVVLRGETFSMGDSIGLTSGDAMPRHQVTLDPYLISTREITFGQYDRFASATGARRPNDFGFGRGNQPVVDVSWDDAVAYADWLKRRTGKPYRLPTEAEWEFAARGGSQSIYWWGSALPQGRAICLGCGSAYDGRSPAPVASLRPNAYGLYDTAGNVHEWVADCYKANYKDAPADGSAYQKPACNERVARGGGFKSPTKSVRVHARRGFDPSTRIDMLGFRVARDG